MFCIEPLIPVWCENNTEESICFDTSVNCFNESETLCENTWKQLKNINYSGIYEDCCETILCKNNVVIKENSSEIHYEWLTLLIIPIVFICIVKNCYHKDEIEREVENL